jgi:transcriptional regulator with XRE-family HTH domain
MSSGGNSMKNFRKAKKCIDVTVGESVKIIRELQDLSQNGLSELTEIPQSIISAIENDRIQLGVERAKILARALQCHPAVLMFPGWDIEPSQPHNNANQRNENCGHPQSAPSNITLTT